MTSIEWLENELKKSIHFYRLIEDIESKNTIVQPNLFEQAKEMHKQEILNAFSAGVEDGFDGLGDSDVEMYYETLANGKDWSKVTLKMRDLFKQNKK